MTNNMCLNLCTNFGAVQFQFLVNFAVHCCVCHHFKWLRCLQCETTLSWHYQGQLYQCFHTALLQYFIISLTVVVSDPCKWSCIFNLLLNITVCGSVFKLVRVTLIFLHVQLFVKEAHHRNLVYILLLFKNQHFLKDFIGLAWGQLSRTTPPCSMCCSVWKVDVFSLCHMLYCVCYRSSTFSFLWQMLRAEILLFNNC